MEMERFMLTSPVISSMWIGVKEMSYFSIPYLHL